MTIEDFKRKCGTEGWRHLIEEYIRKAPAFFGECKLADEIGEMAADLQSALESEKDD